MNFIKIQNMTMVRLFLVGFISLVMAGCSATVRNNSALLIDETPGDGSGSSAVQTALVPTAKPVKLRGTYGIY
ncbi:MAG: hypothetical protein AAFW47_01730, partial [Pseudomonadota bacterium]